MFNYMILKRSIIIALSAAMCTSTGIAHAFDMCKNMFGKMNQSEWRGDHRGRDYGYAPSGYGYGRYPVYSYGYRSEMSESALGILDKRYAMGEIDKKKYEDKKDTITSLR